MTWIFTIFSSKIFEKNSSPGLLDGWCQKWNTSARLELNFKMFWNRATAADGEKTDLLFRTPQALKISKSRRTKFEKEGLFLKFWKNGQFDRPSVKKCGFCIFKWFLVQKKREKNSVFSILAPILRGIKIHKRPKSGTANVISSTLKKSRFFQSNFGTLGATPYWRRYRKIHFFEIFSVFFNGEKSI